MGIDSSKLDLKDAKKLYNDPKFRKEQLYTAFTKYLPQAEFRKDLKDDFKFGLEHYDAIRKKGVPPVTPTPDPEKTPTPDITGGTPEPDPKDDTSKTPDFDKATGRGEGKYTKQAFPLDQAIPGILGLANAQEIYSYAVPEVDAPYLRPQELQIQSQLQNIRNMGQAAVRAGADPLSTYIAGTTAMDPIFQRKQNFDAQQRGQTDVRNVMMDQQAQARNAMMFDKTYNNLIAQARDAQTAEKQRAITSIVKNKAMHDQEENRKKAYIDNLTSAYNVGAISPESFEMAKIMGPMFSSPYNFPPNQQMMDAYMQQRKNQQTMQQTMQNGQGSTEETEETTKTGNLAKKAKAKTGKKK